MAYPYVLHKWEAEKLYEAGDVVRANPAKGNTLAFKCIVGGTSDTADVYANFPNEEPAFPFKITQTLIDGDVTWEAFEPLAEELLKLAPTAVIDLFEVELTEAVNGVDDTLRYHAGKNGLTEDLKFNSVTYSAVPVEVDGFEFSAKGTLPRPTMRIANVNNAITNLIALYNPLAAKVKRIRTFAKFIDTTNYGQAFSFSEESDITDTLVTQGADTFIMETFNDTADPDAKIVETWYIDRIASENQQFVEFELSPKLDLINVGIPRRTIEEFCPWQYRGSECGYVGGQCFTINDQPITTGTDQEKRNADVCGKRLSSCQARFGKQNELPFGGFYGARLQA
jgi:phage-related protein|tara:strand:- start:187 stop:1203 length:1017 start_codon:yes stop_codon:yes gene_type:complete